MKVRKGSEGSEASVSWVVPVSRKEKVIAEEEK